MISRYIYIYIYTHTHTHTHTYTYMYMCVYIYIYIYMASLVAHMVKNLSAVQETWVWSLGLENPLEKEVVTHSSIPIFLPGSHGQRSLGGLQSMGPQIVRYDWVTNTHTYIYIYIYTYICFQGGSAVKNLLVMQEMQETQVLPLVWEDPLEKGMTTHSSILAWRIPWTEEPGGLQSMGSQRVIQDWAQAWPWRLADTQYYMWNRWITSTYCITQGTIFNIL